MQEQRIHQSEGKPWKLLTDRFGIFALYMLMMCFGCVEPFDPEIEKYEELLVVDGLITDTDQPHTVRLTRSSSYNSIYTTPETGAVVRIVGDSGNDVFLEEEKPGFYSTGTGQFTGIPGRYYHLEITTAEGKNYRSGPAVLKSSAPVEALYYEYREEPGPEPYSTIQMVDIFLNTRDPQNQSRFYRWDFLETWEFKAPVASVQYLNRNLCWQQDSSSKILINSTQLLSEDVVSGFKIHTVTNQDEWLKLRYCITVRQYVTDQKTYRYWKDIEQINELGGTLYDVTPSEITGNLYNTEDPYEPVLGYFQVCGVAQKRLFINREDLPPDFYVAGRHDCTLTLVPADHDIEQYLWQGLFYIDTVDDILHGNPARVHRFANKPSCYDCTVLGTNKKPDYW